MYPTLLISVSDKSQAGDARRQARLWAREEGLSADSAEQVALAVTELANNLHLHTTRGGELLLRKLDRDGHFGAEILAIDAGPGAVNFSLFMRDGYSTAGTPGTGLGAVQRASRVFEVQSQPGLGTVLLSQIWPKDFTAPAERWQVGAVNLPMHNESISGDSWCLGEREVGRARIIVADGLGHGPAAAEASRCAVASFGDHKNASLPVVMDSMHQALHATRGAAVAIAELDPAQECLRYVGVGNIAGCIVTPEKSTSLVSMNGTVGIRNEKIQEFSYPWPRGAMLVMSSDGVKTQWNLSRYPGLLNRHASVIAGVLYRDYKRGTDDTTVVVVRNSSR